MAYTHDLNLGSLRVHSLPVLVQRGEQVLLGSAIQAHCEESIILKPILVLGLNMAHSCPWGWLTESKAAVGAVHGSCHSQVRWTALPTKGAENGTTSERLRLTKES